jgi:hypothetical protein
MWRRVVWKKSTDVSEEYNASILRAEYKAKQETNKKQAASLPPSDSVYFYQTTRRYIPHVRDGDKLKLYNIEIVGFEVFTAAVIYIYIWDITPCIPLSVNRRFGRTYRLHLQGRKNKFGKKPAWKRVASRVGSTLVSCWIYFFDH